MKRTVILDELYREELRPKNSYEQYARLLKEDAAHFLAKERVSWIDRPCPGCQAEAVPEAFVRDGFVYHKCQDCYTLYVTPVPEQRALDLVAAEGRSASFRRELFSSQLFSARFRHVLGSLLQWMIMTLDEYDFVSRTYCDCATYDVSWLNLVAESGFFEEVVVVTSMEVDSEKESSREQPFRVVRELSSLSAPADVISALTILDKVSDPVKLLNQIADHLRPGGFLFLTTTTASGFEYQLLGGEAPNLLPLDRLTLFSTEGLTNLLVERGLTVLESSTPGRLDVETVRDYLKERPEDISLPFWDYFFSRDDKRAFADLQLFLQEHRLSSYLRIAARKKP